MSDTDCSELGSLADVQTGPFGSQLHSSDYVTEGTPIITVEHLIGENRISHDGIPLVSVRDKMRLIRYSLQTGDLVFSRVGAIDRCSHVSPSEDGWLFSGRLLRVRPDRSRIDSRFLASYLSHEPSQRWIRDHAVGSTMPCLNTSILKQVPLSLPSLPKQRTIAEILDTTNEAIRSTERLIAKLEQANQGLLLDLLTRGIDENGHLRDSDELRESPVGLVPSSWSVGPLRSYLVLQRGFDITVAEQRSGNIPVVSSSGICSFHDRAMVKGPGVVIGRKGKLGDAYYVATDFWPHDTSLWVKQFKNVVPEFAAVLLKSMRLERFDAATSVPTLNRNFIHPILIAVPPAEEQMQILETLDAPSCRIRREKENLAKLRLVKRGLMDDLLTGRVQVGPRRD